MLFGIVRESNPKIIMRKKFIYCAAIVMAMCIFSGCSEHNSGILEPADVVVKDDLIRTVELVEKFRKAVNQNVETKSKF
jgi:hypothetical protein